MQTTRRPGQCKQVIELRPAACATHITEDLGFDTRDVSCFAHFEHLARNDLILSGVFDLFSDIVSRMNMPHLFKDHDLAFEASNRRTKSPTVGSGVCSYVKPLRHCHQGLDGGWRGGANETAKQR